MADSLQYRAGVLSRASRSRTFDGVDESTDAECSERRPAEYRRIGVTAASACHGDVARGKAEAGAKSRPNHHAARTGLARPFCGRRARCVVSMPKRFVPLGLLPPSTGAWQYGGRGKLERSQP